MRIGHISFRLAGTDGVSLETAKLISVLGGMGYQNYLFAGETEEIGDGSTRIDGAVCCPLAHFTHPDIVKITDEAFGNTDCSAGLMDKIEKLAGVLEKELQKFVHEYQIEMLTVQNVFSLPLNLPLALTIYRFIKKTKIPAINHNHDFYWERERFGKTCIKELITLYYPPKLPSIQHLVINSQAQRELANRGIISKIMPNIFDFSKPPPGIDNFNHDLRQNIEIEPEDFFFLQPTRVIPRKGIELAIELVSRMPDLPIKLVISHPAEFDTQGYLNSLITLARKKDVRLLYIPEKFAPERQLLPSGEKIYSLRDAYIHADFITYPSLYEGFGNALIETIYFRKPFLINRYQIFKDDIESTGIKAVKMDGEITDQVVMSVRELLFDQKKSEELTNMNVKIARQYYSYEKARSILREVFESFKQPGITA